MHFYFFISLFLLCLHLLSGSWSSILVFYLGLLSESFALVFCLARSFFWVFCLGLSSGSFFFFFGLSLLSVSFVWVVCLGLLSGTLVCVFCLGPVSWSFVLALVFVLNLASNKIFYVLLNPSSNTRHREKKPIARSVKKVFPSPRDPNFQTPDRKKKGPAGLFYPYFRDSQIGVY
jgi:hypothetical protein